MKVEIKEKEELLKELTVEVPVETVNKIIDRKFIELQRETEFKGFRKGKVPMDMIKQSFGEKVKFEAAEDILKESYPQVVQQHNLKVASYPNVTSLDYNDNGELVYTATVEVFPEIEKVEIDGLELPDIKVEVLDSDVNEVVEMMQKNFSEMRTVDRPIASNDIVVLDIEKLEDSKNVIPQDRFENSEVDLSNKMTIQEFQDSLPGLKKGDVKDISVKYADDYQDTRFAGAELKYKCTVKEVKERLLDELNDAFAKKTGQGETMLELKLKVRENVQLQKEDEKSRDRKSLVIDFINKKNEIPIPKTLLEDYLKNVVEDIKQKYKDQKIDEAEIKKNYEPVGINTIRWNMLMHKLADQEKVEVKEEDIQNLIQKFAKNYNITPEQAIESIQKSGQIADFRESILEEKVIDFIVSKAKIIPADTK